MKKRKYKLKLRFFVIIAVVICLIGGGIYLFNSSRDSQDSKILADEAIREREQGTTIALYAKAYIANKNLRYDDRYFSGGYPPDDFGVCTDVVWKGFRGIGVNIKDMVDRDIAKNPEAYSEVVSVPDPNLDFRRVPVLEVFFERNARVLTNDPSDILSWQAGDIVTFESSHVAIVSNLRNPWGMPYIIQHGKDPAAEEDRIFAIDGMKISGHYRWQA